MLICTRNFKCNVEPDRLRNIGLQIVKWPTSRIVKTRMVWASRVIGESEKCTMNFCGEPFGKRPLERQTTLESNINIDLWNVRGEYGSWMKLLQDRSIGGLDMSESNPQVILL
jgi:hypothetical protein